MDADAPLADALQKPDGGVLYLLGTSHCSEESVQHASDLVRRKQPSAVVVELCHSRAGLCMERAAEEVKPPPADRTSLGVVSTFSSVLADWSGRPDSNLRPDLHASAKAPLESP